MIPFDYLVTKKGNITEIIVATLEHGKVSFNLNGKPLTPAEEAEIGATLGEDISVEVIENEKKVRKVHADIEKKLDEEGPEELVEEIALDPENGFQSYCTKKNIKFV